MKTARSVPALLLSIAMAFFPKCAVCWAAYASVLGSAWLAKAPVFPWLFPALVALSAVHLALLLRKVRERGIAPFGLSVAGIAVVLGARTLFPEQGALLWVGVGLMLSGSLLNSFSPGRRTTSAGAGEKASLS